jgi:O-antigen/teichoic acid export membrane protein
MIKKIHRYSVTMSIIIAVSISIFLLFGGKPIYLYWTKHAIEYDPILMDIFLISMIINSIWFTSSVVLAATNNHIGYSKLYLITSALAILLCIGIIKTMGSISYIPLSLLVIDIFMLFYIFRKSLMISQDNFSGFLSSIKSITNIGKITKWLQTSVRRSQSENN